MADLTDQIQTDAAAGKSMQVDGQKRESHSLKDLIEADQYLREQTAGTRATLPVRIAKFKLGGAT